MKYDRYVPFEVDEDLSSFEFESISPFGAVRKKIKFNKTDVNGVYNLAFGDVDSNDHFDDTAITGDRNKVLATVAAAVERYTARYPRRWIYFCGNTPARTRLYRIVIGLHLEELSEKYEIYAEVHDRADYVPFQKNMVVDAFIIRRKLVLFHKTFS